MKAPISMFAKISVYFTLLVAASQALAIDHKSLRSDEIRRLMQGEVLIDISSDDSSAGIIKAAIDIPASAKAVWRVMADCARSPKYVPGLVSCKILETASNGKNDVREHVVKWAWFMPPVRSVFRSYYDPWKTIRFQKMDGDLADLSGEWRLEPVNGGKATRLFYSAKIALSLPLPDAMVRGVLERDVPQTLKALRTEVGRDRRQ